MHHDRLRTFVTTTLPIPPAGARRWTSRVSSAPSSDAPLSSSTAYDDANEIHERAFVCSTSA